MFVRAAGLAGLLALLTASVPARAQDGADKGRALAVAEAEAYDGYQTEKADYQLILIDAKGVKTERAMEFYGREVEGKGDQSRIEITDPPDVKGTRLLTWTMLDKADKQWLFLPALGSVKRISGGGKTGAFMGSEFSYEDLSSFEPSKYTYGYIEETKTAGRDVSRYERFPTDPNSGYSKIVVDLDKEYLQPLQMAFFDRKNDHMKTMTFTGYVETEGEWRWAEIMVENHQTGKSSRLVAGQRDLGPELDAFFFDSATLGD